MNGLTITGRIARATTRLSVAALSHVPGAPTPPAPTRLARMLALAVHVERLIDAGDLDDHADAASRLGLTRARLSQIAALLRLPLDVQEGILLGTVRASERELRGQRGTGRIEVPTLPDEVAARHYERSRTSCQQKEEAPRAGQHGAPLIA